MVIMIFLQLLGSMKGHDYFTGQSKPIKRTSTLKKIGIALVLIPGIPIGAVIAATAGVTIAGAYLVKQTSGSLKETVIKGANSMSRSFFYITSPFKNIFKNKQIKEKIKQHIVSQQDVEKFYKMLKEQIQESPQSIYVLVKKLNSSKQNVLDSLLIAIQPGKTIKDLLRLIKQKWTATKIESIELFHSKKLCLLQTPIKQLKKNNLGIIELQFIKMQTFG